MASAAGWLSTGWAQAVVPPDAPASAASAASAVAPAAAASAASASANAMVLEADEVRARPDQDVIAEGNARFQRGPMQISADRMTYEQVSDLAHATGKVRVSRDGNVYTGPELQLKVERFEGFFLRPTYFFSRTQAGGSAERLDFFGEQLIVATGATYTSCRVDDAEGSTPAWVLSTDRVKLDFANNEGIAQGAVLRFYGVPILAAPVLSFPLSDDRKSGWLPPSIDIDNKSGLQVAVPYYWNIAPNRDATLTPAIISKRGAALDTEFRYLEPGHTGRVDLNLLPNDRQAGITRSAFNLEQEGVLLGNTRYSTNVMRVSDDDYWKDLPRGINSLTPRLLLGDARVASDFGLWTTYARVQRWQVLQDVDSPLATPYDRLPQVGVRTWQPLVGGLEFGMEAEANRFVNPEGHLVGISPGDTASNPRPLGSRLHLLGSLAWPFGTPGWTLTPKVLVNAASYRLDAPMADGRDRFHRVVPTFSLDSAWVLERDTQLFGRPARQTMEPRLFYTKTPYREQNGLPNFDSAEKDFNFDSIYTENSFSGVDRVSDAHQLTAGVTTRMIDSGDGSELLRLGLAQRYLFEDQRITPTGDPISQSVSDLLLTGSSGLLKHWRFDTAMQYSPEQRKTVRSIVGVRYSPGPYRTINTNYRFNRIDSAPPGKPSVSEQFEVGWQWPLYGRPGQSSDRGGRCIGAWYSVGRMSYNVTERRLIDSVVGFEYDAGCWIGRVIAKRSSTSDQEATTQLGFELELIGLSRLGTNPLKVLKDNIPGYRLLRDDSAAPAASPTTP
ncbi:LPS-assembly protein LptD [Rhizobacter sp. OV335]|uniref:LPS-assembly protein LptD n=1 Tax=Rhizobacter sp. OV335 TaxID=1500264 RepID=UPI001F25AEA3|nr:LPS assembly protein LptD [Rhizobacter sp. OV335]